MLPANIELRVADMKQPFLPECYQQFDLIHVSLVLLAMKPADWSIVMGNILRLLKRGGWIQWEEIDAYTMTFALRRNTSSEITEMQSGLDFF